MTDADPRSGRVSGCLGETRSECQPRSEGEVEAKGFVDLFHEIGRYSSDAGTYSLNGHRTNLFGLSLGLGAQPGCLCRELDLEGVHLTDVRCDWDHGDDPPAQAGRRGVGSVVTDDDCRPAHICLGTDDGVEVHKSYLAAQHWAQRLSPTVMSQSAAFSDSSQDAKASS